MALRGSIVAGWLEWDDTPTYLTLSDGSEVWISFQGGASLLAGSSITTSATVKVLSAAEGEPAPVPLPAGIALLFGGLGTLSAFRLRKS